MAARPTTTNAVVTTIRSTVQVSCFGLTTLPASAPPRLPAGGATVVGATVVGTTSPTTVLGAATGSAVTGEVVGGVVAAAGDAPSRQPAATATAPPTERRAARTRDIGAEARWSTRLATGIRWRSGTDSVVTTRRGR